MRGFCRATMGEFDLGVIRTDGLSKLGSPIQRHWGDAGESMSGEVDRLAVMEKLIRNSGLFLQELSNQNGSRCRGWRHQK